MNCGWDERRATFGRLHDPKYRELCAEAAEKGYEGFELR